MPRLSDLPLDDDGPTLRRGRRKKTAKWCRGKVGVEHAPTLVHDDRYPPCGPSGWLDRATRTWHQTGGWVCFHIEVCATCGKHLRFYAIPCPDAPEGVRQRDGYHA